MISDTARRRPRLRLQIHDILALVVGYGMAGLFFRAFWPGRGQAPGVMLAALGFYLWLGLTLSGPIVLLRVGPATRPDSPADPGGSPAPATARTGAEWAWLLIGVYWIILGLFVIPSRVPEFLFRDTLTYGCVPIVSALLLLALRKPRTERTATTWTHLAALGVLASWPVAWVCLIILGQRLR
jgi:hypothetical protein